MKKFSANDIFYNNILATPKYIISMQSGSLRINDQINQNQEKSSSIQIIEYTGSYIYENSTKFSYSGSYQYSSSISREFIYATSSNNPDYSGYLTFHDYYTKYLTLKKVFTLNNLFKNYIIENEYADLKYYFKTSSIGNYLPEESPVNKKITFSSLLYPKYFLVPSCSINYLEIPSCFYGDYITPGTVKLNMYVSGVLTASAEDLDKTGKLFQTIGPITGSVIGSVFYNDGIIILTGSSNLTTKTAPYIQPLPEYTESTDSFFNQINPINDYLKWIYFGSYISTEGSAPEAKYELIFQGANYIPTLTMMCHAEKNELFWSNNRSFIEAGQGNEIYVGQITSSANVDGDIYYADSGSFLLPSDNSFKENPYVIIKNTISSSFAHYSASYEPQVFISQIGIYDEQKNLIGIGKLANPVRKTKELDYTFKLKLDL